MSCFYHSTFRTLYPYCGLIFRHNQKIDCTFFSNTSLCCIVFIINYLAFKLHTAQFVTVLGVPTLHLFFQRYFRQHKLFQIDITRAREQRSGSFLSITSYFPSILRLNQFFKDGVWLLSIFCIEIFRYFYWFLAVAFEFQPVFFPIPPADNELTAGSSRTLDNLELRSVIE